MKLYNFLVLLFGGYALCSVISNVRLVNHTSYMIDVITKTVSAVEQSGWCNLKLPEYIEELKLESVALGNRYAYVVVNWKKEIIHVNENSDLVLSEVVVHKRVNGTVKYTNGFVVSIQRVDIQQSTVQQVWFFNSTLQATTVTVQGTLRMHSLAVGYDVVADLEDGNHRYTTIYVHPLVTFAFSIIKNVIEDTIRLVVVGNVPRTTLRPSLSPQDNVTDVLTTVFNPTLVTAPGINAWGSEVFEPILGTVIKQIEFPTICYNCPVTA